MPRRRMLKRIKGVNGKVGGESDRLRVRQDIDEDEEKGVEGDDTHTRTHKCNLRCIVRQVPQYLARVCMCV